MTWGSFLVLLYERVSVKQGAVLRVCVQGWRPLDVSEHMWASEIHHFCVCV